MLEKNKISLYGIITGFLILLSFIFTEPPEGLNRTAWLTAGIAILMTVWWITEAVPIYITGLMPLVLFPLLETFDIKTVSASYAHPLVLLFLGGFIIASAMESSGLHKRIALKILGLSGTSPSKIIAGFMDGKVLDEKEVSVIATLPSLEEARAKIVGILATPAQKLVSILLAPGSKIANLARAKSLKN